MKRVPPQPASSLQEAKRRPSPTRGEGASARDVKACLKRSLLVDTANHEPQQNPSPLVGEGGVRPRRTPGEGASTTVVRAKSLRSRMTDAERKLWYLLRDRRFAATKFRRQVSLGRYVADFLSFEKRIVVEVDGGQHSESASDGTRDDWFRSQGFTVVRFWNNDVLTNLRGLFTLLADIVARTPHPSSQLQAAAMTPSPTRGEGKRTAR